MSAIKFIVPSIVCLLVSSLSTLPQAPAEYRQKQRPAAKRSLHTAKGTRLHIELIPEKSSILLGEPTFVYLVIHNPSSRPLQVMVGGEQIPESSNKRRFIFSAVRADGLTVVPPALPVHYAGPIDFMTGPNSVPARGEYRFERFLPGELKLTSPGRYTIHCRKQLEILTVPKDGGWDQKQKPDTISVEVSAVITVRPPDPTALGEVIDKLGKTMTARNPDESGVYDSTMHAFTALCAIPDVRAIPWFVKLLQFRNSSYKGCAVQALAKFDSPVAFRAIQSGLATRAADLKDWTTDAQRRDAAETVRLDAARAISDSPYPEAQSALFALKADANEFIRLQVVHGAGKRISAESTSVLSEMTHDHSKMIRDEAARYLALRNPSK